MVTPILEGLDALHPADTPAVGSTLTPRSGTKSRIMLPRQIHFQTWSLDELFGANSEEVLPGLREEFTALLREMVDAGLDGMRSSEVEKSRS